MVLTDPEEVAAFKSLVRMGSMAADVVAMEGRGTDAELTRAIVEEALECLLGNRLIQIVPLNDWPDWTRIDRPYGRIPPMDHSGWETRNFNITITTPTGEST